MSEILDPLPNEKSLTNYKQWSFRFLIYLVIMNLYIAYAVSQLYFNVWVFGLVSVLSTVFWLGGIVLTVLSHIKKEERNYQYHVSVWGFMILTVASVAFTIIRSY